MIDRIVPHAEVASLRGDFYRLKTETSAAPRTRPTTTMTNQRAGFSLGGAV
jgi:hypothetical protein